MEFKQSFAIVNTRAYQLSRPENWVPSQSGTYGVKFRYEDTPDESGKPIIKAMSLESFQFNKADLAVYNLYKALHNQPEYSDVIDWLDQLTHEEIIELWRANKGDFKVTFDYKSQFGDKPRNALRMIELIKQKLSKGASQNED